MEDRLYLSLADYDVLVLLTEAPDGRLRMFEIVEDLQWEQSRLSHHVARMQRRGLVAREECTTDKRGAFVVLTDAGRDAIEKAAPGHVDTVRRLVFDGLSKEQVTTLESFVSRVLSRLAPAEEAAPAGGRVHGRRPEPARGGGGRDRGGGRGQGRQGGAHRRRMRVGLPGPGRVGP